MKKVIAWILTATLVMSCSAVAFAANLDDGNPQANIGVYARAIRDVAGEYTAGLQNGGASVSTGQGVSVSVSGAPSSAFQLVVVPVPSSESAAWAWFTNRLGDHGTPVQVYDIYFLNTAGSRVNASSVSVTMDAPAGVDTLVVCSLTTGGTAKKLTSTVQSGKVTFSTDGSTYYVLAEAGGSGAPTYPPTVEQPAKGGSVTVAPQNPQLGDIVTVTPQPKDGYRVKKVTAVDKNGNSVIVVDNGNGNYTFTQQDSSVTVTVLFEQIPCNGGPTCPTHDYVDLDSDEWYHEAVDYVLINKLMVGYGGGVFAPNDKLSRAMLAQIFYNNEGRPTLHTGSSFTDVPDAAWYADAVIWAHENNIVLGYEDGTYRPNDPITREQVVVMLWRYTGNPASTHSLDHFSDTDLISGYALEAIRWANETGVINGYGDRTLRPKGTATRAEVAQILKNYMVQFENATE